MNSTHLKALEKAKAKVAVIEAKIAAEMRRRLADLPRQHGYDSMKSFMKALKAASAGKSPAAAKTGKRTRVTITDEIRAEVKKLIAAGKTGLQIAKLAGISLPSVYNIKKALGLTSARKKKR